MHFSPGFGLKGLFVAGLSLAALRLAPPALAQEPGAAAAPGGALLQFLVLLVAFLVGIIVLTALLAVFLLWAGGQPIPGLSPMLQDLTAREVDAEGRPTGPSNLQKIALALGGLVVVALVIAFTLPAIRTAGQPAAPAATPTAAAQATAPPATRARVVQAPAGVLQTIQASGCGACHTIPGVEGAAGTVGPSLAGIGARAEEIIADPAYTGGAGTAEGYIRESIVSPNAYVAEGFQPNIMPQTFEQTIPADQLEALVGYLASLK